MAAIGDIKTDIIDFYNEAVRGKLGSDATDLDISIQLVLNDLSTELDSLRATDEDQTLEVDDKTLAYPTDFKSVVSIVLINSGGVRQAPMRPLKSGHQEYRDLRYLSASNGLPIQYSEFDSKFWLWRPADGDYTSEIEYYRYHPKDATAITTILFDTFFTDCIKFGTVFYKQAMKGNPKYISIWKAMYDNEKEKCRLLLPTEPQISGDY